MANQPPRQANAVAQTPVASNALALPGIYIFFGIVIIRKDKTWY